MEDARQEIRRILQDVPRVRLFVDSGAFSAFNAGKPIALHDYARFCRRLPDTVFAYVTLDVIYNARATHLNYIRMRDEYRLKPVPIFTRGAPWERLHQYFEDSDYVACGGTMKKKQNEEGTKRYLSRLMHESQGKRIHLFGVTVTDWLVKYQPFSCDSSTWRAGATTGHINLYLGNFKDKTISRKTALKGLTGEMVNALQCLGYDHRYFQHDEVWRSWKALEEVGLRNQIWRMFDLRRRYGVNLFIAITSERVYLAALEAYRAVRQSLAEHGRPID